MIPVGTFQETGMGWWKQSETGGTLRERDSKDGASNMIAFDRTQSSVSGNVAGTLRSNSAASEGVNDGKADNQCVAFNTKQSFPDAVDSELCPTLRPGGEPGKSGGVMGIASGFGVRRLTPTECERLQGFPDGWTDVNGMSDSARYRMLGNAVAVPVAEWIGRRILETEIG